MVVEQWDETFTTLDAYRGVNANMHTVEAFLAAADVTGDRSLRDRALRIMTRVVHDFGPAHDWRLPEHFDEQWTPAAWTTTATSPAHPFRPYGATIGHWLEWARLALNLRAALGADAPGLDARPTRAPSSRRRCATAGRSTAPTGSSTPPTGTGTPVVRERMHWVAAEATATAAALHAATGDASYAAWYAHLVGPHRCRASATDELGSWWHELDAAQPAQRRGLERQAGHLPRVPGHPVPAPAAHADARRRPARRVAD